MKRIARNRSNSIKGFALIWVWVLTAGLVCFPMNSYCEEYTAIEDAWPPYMIIDGKSKTGIDYDIYKELGKRVDINFKFIHAPLKRALYMLKQGQVDIVSGVARTPERETFLYFVTPPYHAVEIRIYVNKGNENIIQSYEDLYKYEIGMVGGSSYFSKFDNDIKIKKHEVTSEIQLLHMLKGKRFKAFIGSASQVDYDIMLNNMFIGKFKKALYKPDSNTDLYLAISKKSPLSRLILQISEAVKQMKEDGALDKISNEYLTN
jgi:polar amino acid transport system substrate-binding protein